MSSSPKTTLQTRISYSTQSKNPIKSTTTRKTCTKRTARTTISYNSNSRMLKTPKTLNNNNSKTL